MMSARSKAHAQVFLSFALSDKRLAERVTHSLRAADITVVRADEVGAGDQYDNVIRDALKQSDAVVVALSHVGKRQDISANVLFEIGAAVGADKPIYVIVDDATARLRFNVPNLQVLPISRLGEVADKLRVAA